MKTFLACLALFCAVSLAVSSPSYAADVEPEQEMTASEQEPRMFEIDYELDAYYTNVDLYIPLTKTPIPSLGERTETEIYRSLIANSLVPRFLVIEGSYNPMPNLGVYLKEHETGFYNQAQVSGSFNWVKTVTAGFEEPYAASIFVGNVIDFKTPGSRDTKGKGHIGYLFSMGNFHIKDNELINDYWQEFEWKIKGDRKSPVKKLNWSFRAGAKVHDNPDITDIVYLSFRRSRVDYRPESRSVFNNSGFEYTVDLDNKEFNSIRHYFFVDKKWPFSNRRLAFSLAAGFVWESVNKYTGPLAAGRGKDDLQILLRPNIEF